MRLMLFSVVCMLATAALGQEREGVACDLACLLGRHWGSALAPDVCDLFGCLGGQTEPAWQAGRMEAPDDGGFAFVASVTGADKFVVTCESRGPMSVILRSGQAGRGEVQLLVDGVGIEWLTLQQRNGSLVSEIPRASRLLFALQDGATLEVIAADGRRVARFGLRGSSRAITTAMDYCSAR